MEVPGDSQRGEVKRIRTEPWEPMSEDWEMRVQEREDGRRKNFGVTFQRPSHESFKMSREIMQSGTVGLGRVGVISVTLEISVTGKMIEMCYRLKVWVPVKFMCRDQSPCDDIVGGVTRWAFLGVVRIRWGHKGRALMIGLVPSEETVECMWGLSRSQEGALTRASQPAPSPGTLQTPEPRANRFLCLIRPVTGTLLRQPELTNTLVAGLSILQRKPEEIAKSE